MRPGWPSRPRPTGLPHSQNRRFSGTTGLSMTAERGSTGGAGGTVVMPAPRRAPRRRAEDVPHRRGGRGAGGGRGRPVGGGGRPVRPGTGGGGPAGPARGGPPGGP